MKDFINILAHQESNSFTGCHTSFFLRQMINVESLVHQCSERFLLFLFYCHPFVHGWLRAYALLRHAIMNCGFTGPRFSTWTRPAQQTPPSAPQTKISPVSCQNILLPYQVQSLYITDGWPHSSRYRLRSVWFCLPYWLL